MRTRYSLCSHCLLKRFRKRIQCACGCFLTYGSVWHPFCPQTEAASSLRFVYAVDQRAFETFGVLAAV